MKINSLLPKAFTALVLFFSMAYSAYAADIAITYNEGLAVFSPAQKAQIEKIRQLWDYIIYDNGLSGSRGVMNVELIYTHMDGLNGRLARESGSNYAINSRGKLVVDTTVRIYLDIDDGIPSWEGGNLEILGELVFHEMGHALGLDAGVWQSNGYVTGIFDTPFNGRYGTSNSSALATYKLEYDPEATFIPVDLAGHLLESINPLEIMTPIHTRGAYLSKTVIKIIEENGYTVNPNFTAGLIKNMLPGAPGMPRNLKDEDMMVFELPKKDVYQGQ